MGRIKLLFLIKLFLPALLIFILSACENGNGTSTAGNSLNSCYSAKSEIYKPSAAASSERRTSAAITVSFLDGADEILDFQVHPQDGTHIVLPDIRARYCMHGQSGRILAGWARGSVTVRAGQKYRVPAADVTFNALWEDGNEIYTAGELNAVRDNLTGNYKLMRDIDLRDYKTGEGWRPIGDETGLFTGKFYGNSYIIDNLTIDNATGSTAGLFGTLSGSSAVYDLTLTLSADGIKLYDNDVPKAAGALAGHIVLNSDSDNVTVENVNTSGGGIQIGNSGCGSTPPSLTAGGIVGDITVAYHAFGDNPELRITGSSNGVDVSTHPTSINADCYAYLGGIIGSSSASSSNYTVSIKISGENHGNISSAMLPLVNIGGIAGLIYTDGFSMPSGVLDGCTNYGAVKTEALSTIPYISGAKLHIGGIAGATDTQIRRCVNAGAVSIINNNYTIVGAPHPVFAAGGIAGLAEGSYGREISESENIAPVFINAVESGADNISVYAGGLCGLSEALGSGTYQIAEIAQSINRGMVTAFVSDNVPTIHAYAGGLVGYGDAHSCAVNPYTCATEISDSYNTGMVSAKTFSGTSLTAHYAWAGGIAGGLGGGSLIKHTYNSGAVHAAADGYMSSHKVYAGGIAGYLNHADTSVGYNINLNVTIEAIPTSPSPDDGSGWIVGAGVSSGIFNNYSQYDLPLDTAPGSDDGTLASPPTQATYETDLSFDLMDIWTLDTNPPTLQWETE
jgi:hypothetical protein